MGFETDLDLFVIERDALDNARPCCLVRFGIPLVLRF